MSDALQTVASQLIFWAPASFFAIKTVGNITPKCHHPAQFVLNILNAMQWSKVPRCNSCDRPLDAVWSSTILCWDQWRRGRPCGNAYFVAWLRELHGEFWAYATLVLANDVRALHLPLDHGSDEWDHLSHRVHVTNGNFQKTSQSPSALSCPTFLGSSPLLFSQCSRSRVCFWLVFLSSVILQALPCVIFHLLVLRRRAAAVNFISVQC